MNVNLYVIFLPSIWMKQRKNLFLKYEHENKVVFLVTLNLNSSWNLEL